MKNLKRLLLIAVMVSFIAGQTLPALKPQKDIDIAARLKATFPGMPFMEKKGNFPYYVSDDGTVAFSSHDITPAIRGYAGPINILIVLRPDGTIRGIAILDHRETKNYVHYMENPDYLRRFVGKSVHDPFEIDRDIDGISRATVSVEALAKTVRESSGKIAGDVLGIEVKSGGNRRSFTWGWLVYMLLFCPSLLLYFLTRRDKAYLRFRDISLMGGVLILGISLSGSFSILHIFNLLLLQPSSSLLSIAITTTTLASIAVAGRFYCGWLCPFGAVAEFIGRIPVKKWEIRAETDGQGRDLKYVIAALAAIIVLVSRKPEFGNYETYVTLFSLHGSYLSWALVTITLLMNLRVRRFWCRYLCPVAAFTGLLSRKDDRYVSTTDCPMGNKPSPPAAECIRCNRCYKRNAASNGVQGTERGEITAGTCRDTPFSSP